MSLLAETLQAFPLTENLLKQSYRSLQWGKGYFSVLHRGLTSQIETLWYPKVETQTITPQLAQQLQQRVDELLDQDWADAKAGIYPIELLFQEPWDEFLQFYPQVCLDLPLVWQRAHYQTNPDFSIDISPNTYPDYYLQNFHHQTNGYLSGDSANLYDLQVELVFGGKADAMRRRILAPLRQTLTQQGSPSNPMRILDLACGTGRTLLQLRAAFPDAELVGLDLSQSYIDKARQRLNRPADAGIKLLVANAEQCPLPDQSFHGITNVFMLHELPEVARHQVLQEAYRLLKPGGILVICDSIQLQDSPEFSPMMQNFAALFHEPFYDNYVQDDLEQRLQRIGFRPISTQVHFLSKYLIAYKPEHM